jgi:hypothetical protein
MRTARSICGTAIAATVVGCGGGSSNSTSYGFVPPAMASEQTYVVTDVNPTSTSVNTVIQTVTTVNPDGSFSYHEDVPPGVAINGPNYLPGDYADDNGGHLLTFTPNGQGTPCTAGPRGPGPVFPVTVGQNWQWQYSYTCVPSNLPPIATPDPTHTESGSVTGIESVTVPAGTFAAVKLQSTIHSAFVFFPGAGTQCASGCIETRTEWLETGTGRLIKSTDTYNYGTSGTLTTTVLLSETRELASK